MIQIDPVNQAKLSSSQYQSKQRVSIVNLVLVTKSQHNASLIERLLSSIKAKTYSIRWAYNPQSLKALLDLGRPDVILLDATDKGVSGFIDFIEKLPSFDCPIIALAKDSQMKSELDQRIPNLVKARIDSSRIGRSLLSRTIRQVVAASYAASNPEAGEGVMEVQGVRVNSTINNHLAANMLSVSELARKAFARNKPLAHSQNIHLYDEIESGPYRILGDSKHLTNIMMILLENAIKHTDPNGAVGLSLVGEPSLETLHLTVWDTGVGMDPQQIINLYRADWLSNDVDRERNLRYVQKYTQFHEGLLSIKSDVGRGTRVTISLPWASAVQLSNGQIWQNSFKRQIRILLVEDDDQYIETISSYLQAKNFEVVIARNGEEGLTQVAHTRPDLVLMDMEMPIMDGFEAIRRIRALKDMELAQLPIIAFTALNLSRDRHAGMMAGANDYITKPVSLRWLSQSITSQLEKIHLIETISS